VRLPKAEPERSLGHGKAPPTPVPGYDYGSDTPRAILTASLSTFPDTSGGVPLPVYESDPRWHVPREDRDHVRSLLMQELGARTAFESLAQQ
jgi:hypothetical protein